MLNSHPKITAYSELFLEQDHYGEPWGGAKDGIPWSLYVAEKRIGLTDANSKEILFEYLDGLFAPRNGVEALGFKLMYGQARAFPDLLAYFESVSTRLIHLIRANQMDVLVSRWTAWITDIYHVRAGDKLPLAKISLDTSSLLDDLTQQETESSKWRNMLSSSKLKNIEIRYEDVCSKENGFDEIFDFLGVVSTEVQLNSSLLKINDAPHSEIIENYESVKQVLAGTQFSNMLR